jgi:hypothetical protein
MDRFHIETTASIATREAAFAMSVRRSLCSRVSIFGLAVADYRLFHRACHF